MTSFSSIQISVADLLRRNSIIAYRTRQLQKEWPDEGYATAERAIWENDEDWQPIRRAVEMALVAYDFGEALVAVNLVLRPASTKSSCASSGAWPRPRATASPG